MGAFLVVVLDELVEASDYAGEQHAAVLRLYRAYFNREPDLAGAKYWLTVSDLGYSLLDIAGFMAGSQEFYNAYNGTTNEEYTFRVYANVLGRPPDAAGYEYWLGLVNRGELDRVGVVFWITQGPEFIRANPYLPASAETPPAG